MTLPGIGVKRALALADTYLTWDALTKATIDQVAATVGPATATKAFADLPADAPVQDLPDEVHIISIREPGYPNLLRSIPDAPPLLWFTGTLPPEDMPALAVVGTRHPTAYGTAVAQMAGTGAAEHGIAVISGLALGSDSIGHRAALDAGGATWAVLGQGVDTLPASGDRAELAARIIGNGGGLISELPPGVQVAGHQLTRRNRLQSGMSQAILIAQTGLGTPEQAAGTMHAAKYALAQGRTLAVARPSGTWATEEKSAGNMVLSDPNGMDPSLMYLTGHAATLIAARRPAADVVINSRDDLPGLFATVKAIHANRNDQGTDQVAEGSLEPALF